MLERGPRLRHTPVRCRAAGRVLYLCPTCPSDPGGIRGWPPRRTAPRDRAGVRAPPLRDVKPVTAAGAGAAHPGAHGRRQRGTPWIGSTLPWGKRAAGVLRRGQGPLADRGRDTAMDLHRAYWDGAHGLLRAEVGEPRELRYALLAAARGAQAAGAPRGGRQAACGPDRCRYRRQRRGRRPWTLTSWARAPHGLSDPRRRHTARHRPGGAWAPTPWGRRYRQVSHVTQTVVAEPRAARAVATRRRGLRGDGATHGRRGPTTGGVARALPEAVHVRAGGARW
mmetsp:Transcript_3022/g.7205  ORF Transcript_3022/g.7205 Transcript_3022/m.7205 type:complete len:281 (+) Transcript_3022:192-1034(+)